MLNPENPPLVEVHCPANTADVDVMFAMALLGKIKHITLSSSKIARVRVYHVTYATRESAIPTTGLHVGQIVFHQEIPDLLKRDSMLDPLKSMSERTLRLCEQDSGCSCNIW